MAANPATVIYVNSTWSYRGISASDVSCSGAPGVQANAWIDGLISNGVNRTGDATGAWTTNGSGLTVTIQCLDSTEASGWVTAWGLWNGVGEPVVLRLNDNGATSRRNSALVSSIAVNGGDPSKIDVVVTAAFNASGSGTGWGIGGCLASVLGGSNTSPSYRLFSKTAGTTAGDADGTNWRITADAYHVESPFSGFLAIYARGNSSGAAPGLFGGGAGYSTSARALASTSGTMSPVTVRTPLTINCAASAYAVADAGAGLAHGFTFAGIEFRKSSSTTGTYAMLRMRSTVSIIDCKVTLTGSGTYIHGMQIEPPQGTLVLGCEIDGHGTAGMYCYGPGVQVLNTRIKGGTWGVYFDAGTGVGAVISGNQFAGQSTAAVRFIGNSAAATAATAPSLFVGNVFADTPIGFLMDTLVANTATFRSLRILNNVFVRCTTAVSFSDASADADFLRSMSVVIYNNSTGTGPEKATTRYGSGDDVAYLEVTGLTGLSAMPNTSIGFKLPSRYSTLGTNKNPLGNRSIAASNDRSCR